MARVERATGTRRGNWQASALALNKNRDKLITAMEEMLPWLA